jgi:hypothetical protein
MTQEAGVREGTSCCCLCVKEGQKERMVAMINKTNAQLKTTPDSQTFNAKPKARTSKIMMESLTISRSKTFSAAAIIFNILLLVKSHGAFACESCPSDNFSTAAFLERLQKNGVDGLELIDLIFMACVTLLGMELVNTIVKAAARKSTMIFLVSF